MDDRARPRRDRESRKRQLGVEGRRLRVAARESLHGLSLRRRRGRDDRPRVRSLRESNSSPNGFTLPRAKQRTAWENPDSLLVSREWSPGELTTSGYPFVVKRLERGQPLSSAVEVFRGSASDGGYGVTPLVLHDGAGDNATLIERPLSTFEAEYYLVTASGPRRLGLPLKSQPAGLVAGRLLFILQEEWSANGTVFPQGSLVRWILPRQPRTRSISNRRSSMRPAPAKRSRRRANEFAPAAYDLRKRPRARLGLYARREAGMDESAARSARRLVDRRQRRRSSRPERLSNNHELSRAADALAPRCGNRRSDQS